MFIRNEFLNEWRHHSWGYILNPVPHRHWSGPRISKLFKQVCIGENECISFLQKQIKWRSTVAISYEFNESLAHADSKKIFICSLCHHLSLGQFWTSWLWMLNVPNPYKHTNKNNLLPCSLKLHIKKIFPFKHTSNWRSPLHREKSTLEYTFQRRYKCLSPVSKCKGREKIF